MSCHAHVLLIGAIIVMQSGLHDARRLDLPKQRTDNSKGERFRSKKKNAKQVNDQTPEDQDKHTSALLQGNSDYVQKLQQCDPDECPMYHAQFGEVTACAMPECSTCPFCCSACQQQVDFVGKELACTFEECEGCSQLCSDGEPDTGEQEEADVPEGPEAYYAMQKGDVGCPPGKEIRSKYECETAVTELGLCHDKGWDSTYGGLPSYCSHKHTCEGHDWHFNSHPSGKGRGDMVPICKKEATTSFQYSGFGQQDHYQPAPPAPPAVWEKPTLEERWGLRSEELTPDVQGSADQLGKGFENAGNSCYMAAALQILLHTPVLLEFVTKEENILNEDSDYDVITFENRKKLVAILKDIKELAERIKGSKIKRSVTRVIRQRLMEIGLQVDSGGSQEDASDVLFKIFEAFPETSVPGFAQFATYQVEKKCDPAQNPFVRVLPGSKMSKNDFAEWKVQADGSCTSEMKVDPPSGFSTTLPETGSVTVEELLSPKSVKLGDVSEDDVKALYNTSIAWSTCTRDGEIQTCAGCTFDPGFPKNQRYCDVNNPKHQIYPTLQKVQLDGSQNVTLYEYEKVDDWQIPDQQLVMLKVNRYAMDWYGNSHHITTTLDIPKDGKVDLTVMDPITSSKVTKKFQLSSFTIHGGGLGGGHWTAAARKANGQWMGLNDDSVFQYDSPADAVAQCSNSAQFMTFEQIS